MEGLSSLNKSHLTPQPELMTDGHLQSLRGSRGPSIGQIICRDMSKKTTLKLCIMQTQDHAASVEQLFPKPSDQTSPHQAMTHLILQD